MDSHGEEVLSPEALQLIIEQQSDKPPPRMNKHPILQRDHVYCRDSFNERIVDWFLVEWKRLSKKPESQSHKPKAPPAEATRVQPSRSAKKRKPDDTPSTATPAKKKKTESDYILDLDFMSKSSESNDDDTSGDMLEHFQQRILNAVSEKVKQLEAKAAQGEGVKTLCRCAFAKLPLSCTDMVYCLHGLNLPKNRPGGGRRRAPAGEPEGVPVAEMLPSPTLGKWSGQMLGEEDTSDSVVEVGGLRFTVDVCDGFIKIVML